MKNLLKISGILVAVFVMFAVVIKANAQSTNNTVVVTLASLGESSCSIDDYTFNGSSTLTAITLAEVNGTLACDLYATSAESVDMQVTDLVWALTNPFTIVDDNVMLTTMTAKTQNGSITAWERATTANTSLSSSLNLVSKLINHVGQVSAEVGIEIDLDAGTPADTYTGTGSVVITA